MSRARDCLCRFIPTFSTSGTSQATGSTTSTRPNWSSAMRPPATRPVAPRSDSPVMAPHRRPWQPVGLSRLLLPVTAAELAVSTHLTCHARHFAGEGRELADHSVDRVFQFENLALGFPQRMGILP